MFLYYWEHIILWCLLTRCRSHKTVVSVCRLGMLKTVLEFYFAYFIAHVKTKTYSLSWESQSRKRSQSLLMLPIWKDTNILNISIKKDYDALFIKHLSPFCYSRDLIFFYRVFYNTNNNYCSDLIFRAHCFQ